MPDHDLIVKFWGVRGSYAVPGKRAIRYGGNTSCVEVRTKDHLLILDAGTGVIELGHELMRQMNDGNGDSITANLVFSHTHHDHIQGLLYFAPAYCANCTINLYGSRSFTKGIEEVLALSMAPLFSPVELKEFKAELNFHNLTERDTLLFKPKDKSPALGRNHKSSQPAAGEMLLTPLRNYAHPKIGTFILKIETAGRKIVYATDTEGYVGGDQRLIRFAQNADLLIHDAQYTPDQYLQMQGYGHSTYQMAAEVARAADVKQLVLFHHDPYHDDDKLAEIESKAQEIYPNTVVGAEGVELAY